MRIKLPPMPPTIPPTTDAEAAELLLATAVAKQAELKEEREKEQNLALSKLLEHAMFSWSFHAWQLKRLIEKGHL